MKELKLLIKFYKNRICWLSANSRQLFGMLMGGSVAVLVENSHNLAQLDNGQVLKQYKADLKLLVDEQLVNKKTVYFIKYGHSTGPKHPQGLPFTKFKPE